MSANPAIMNRQLFMDQFGLTDEARKEKRYGALREAWGFETLGKMADDIEEQVPQLEGALDWMFGSKPFFVAEEHERPRPWRGPTANPAIADAARKKIEEEWAREAEFRANAADAEAAREAKEAEEREEAEAEMWALQPDLEDQKTRLAYLYWDGRNAQKLRLGKKDRQLEKVEREHHCSMFAHLYSDAVQEWERQKKIYKTEKAIKEAAAAKANKFRAQEDGARQAAKALAVGGKQLGSAKKDADQACQSNMRKAIEQEKIAREARINQDKAEEIMKREEEKQRAALAQVKYNKAEAKALYYEVAAYEHKEIKELMEEQGLMERFIAVWQERLKKVSPGSPGFIMIMGQIDILDPRLDTVHMEKAMFLHMYSERPKPPKESEVKEWEEDEENEGKEPPWTIFYNKMVKDAGVTFPNLPKISKPVWVEAEQRPGCVVLGKPPVGPIRSIRKVVVEKPGDENYSKLQLPEEPLNHFKSVAVRPDFFTGVTGQEGLFLSRIDKEKGEKEGKSKMTVEKFKLLWGQDRSHKVQVSGDECSASLRFPAKFIWGHGWIPEQSTKHLLKKDPPSFMLGPKRFPFKKVFAPGFHEKDTPENTLAIDGQRRVYARIVEWMKERGDKVKPGEDLAIFEVFDDRKNKGGKQGIYAPEVGDKAARNYIKKDDGSGYTNKVLIKANATGYLQGILRDPGSKIFSYDVLAEIDYSDDGWDKCVLPAGEFPEA